MCTHLIKYQTIIESNSGQKHNYSLLHVIPMEYKQEEHVYAIVYAGEIYIA